MRKLFWVDTREMLADVVTKGGIDRPLPHSVSNDCKYGAKYLPVSHTKADSATNSSKTFVGFEHRNPAVGFEHRILEGRDSSGHQAEDLKHPDTQS